MIYTKRQYITRYLGLSKGLDTAIMHLLSQDLSQLSNGRNPIDGEEVFVNRFGYETMPEEKAAWEGHSQYADMHVLLSGRERIGVSNVNELKQTQSKPEEDFVGYEGPVSAFFPMTPEDVLIVFPEDAHMVKVQDGAPTRVEKACYKIKV